MRRLVGFAAVVMTFTTSIAAGGTGANADGHMQYGGAEAAATLENRGVASSGAPKAGPGVIAAYTLIVPRSVARSGLQARAVVPTGTGCPLLHTRTNAGRHRGRSMSLRIPGASTGTAFASIRVCEANMPGGSAVASIGDVDIPAALPHHVSKLAIIADTGCRIKGSSVQDCLNGWPLAQNASSIAGADPDAIIMLGDYFYRESACPVADAALCGGSPAPPSGEPFKDSDAGWLVDAITPMAPLFASAPLLIVRGNHEACNRGGNGYFLFFDASPLGPAACAPSDGVAPENITPSWAVHLPVVGGRELRLVTVDTAYGNDEAVSDWVATQAPAYERAHRLARRGSTSSDTWLLTHRPLFGLVSNTYSTGPTWSPWGSVDQEAAAEGLLDPYDAVLSSHIHLAQAVNVPGQPAQLVIGNGGTALDPATGYTVPPFGPLLDGTGAPLSPAFAPYPNATSQWTDVRWGYVIAQPGALDGQWTFAFHSPDELPYAACELAARTLGCA